MWVAFSVHEFSTFLKYGIVGPTQMKNGPRTQRVVIVRDREMKFGGRGRICVKQWTSHLQAH